MFTKVASLAQNVSKWTITTRSLEFVSQQHIQFFTAHLPFEHGSRHPLNLRCAATGRVWPVKVRLSPGVAVGQSGSRVAVVRAK